MRNKLFTLFVAALPFFAVAQTANNCGNYTTTGSSSSGYLPGSNTACNGSVPGTVNTVGGWSGFGCSGTLISSVVGPPVTCLNVAYTAVNTDDFATLTTNTGGVLTITGVNVGVSGNVIGPYMCGTDVTGYGDVMVTVCSTIPFSTLTLTNSGCSSGWVINCATPMTMPCSMTGLTANVGACVAGPNTYSTNGQITFTNPPATGQLIVEDCNGVQQVFNAPFVSPKNYSLTGQNANGAPCDITAYFTANPTCTQTTNYTAPSCACNISNFTANIGLCDQSTNQYAVNGTLSFTSPPPGGQLVIQVDNGPSTFTTTINPPFISPLNWNITGIPSDGAGSTVTAFFTALPACSSSINFTAPTSCLCFAEVGTFNATVSGSSNTDYVLCYGDVIDITTNNDWVGPGEQFSPPGPVYNEGVSWLIYSCPPTVALTPDPLNDIPDDPCFLGLYSDFDMSDVNDLFMINSYPAGTFTDNTIYYVPITMYSMASGTYSFVNGTTPCYELGTPFAVQYLPEFTYTIDEDCATHSAAVTVNGGLPAMNGSNFTASNLLPVTATFGNTTATDGGTITINGLNFNDSYSFTIDDGNGCPYTVTGGPFFSGPPIGAGVDQTICVGASVTLNGSGAGVGGSYTWNNGVTNGVAFSPVATTTYTVTGTDINGCQNTDQVIVTVNPLPLVSAGPDQTLCAGDPTVLNGSGAVSYTWNNGVTNGVSFTPAATSNYTVTGTNANGCQNTDIVLVTVDPLPPVTAGPDQIICIGDQVTLSGGGAGVGATYTWTLGGIDGVPFTPGATATYMVTGTDANVCTNTDQVTVTVNPFDNASFTYPLGLTYCQTGTDPTPTITGVNGGAFSYTVLSGGPALNLNTTTGAVVLLSSDPGTYAITYNTAGAPLSLCPETSTLNMTITDNPVADFTFGVYCANNVDPSPTFISGGTGGVFSASPAGLLINPGTGLVDLSASVPGTYAVTNTVNVPGCMLATATDNIVVNELPVATISGTASICPGAALPDVTITITAGTAGWDVTYNHNGTPVTINTNTSPYTISAAALGSYDMVSITDANGCTNAMTGNATISNYALPNVNASNDQEICNGNNLVVQNFGSDIPGSTFNWTNTTGTNVGFGLSGSGNIPIFLATNTTGADLPVTISVEAVSPQGCVGPPSTFVITVHPNPIVAFSAGPREGCEPFVVTFQNDTDLPGQNCTWNFGPGLGANGCGAVETIFSAGIYSVTLQVTTADGCFGTYTENNYIVVHEQAEAAFSFSPQVIDVDDTEVQFQNLSDNADGFEWDFGDTTVLNNQTNPSHIYPANPNEYLVMLIATNESFCPDTAYQIVHVQDVIVFYVPNVFTPDHDEFNEGFLPVFTSGFDPYDYHLTIFNRWGEIIFESYNASIGWDGTYGDQGLVEDGAYIWQIEFQENMSDKRHTEQGHIIVLR